MEVAWSPVMEPKGVFIFSFLLFKAALMAYGSSQVRGRTGATELQQHRLFNPPSKARGIEPASSWILVGLITSEPQQELLNLSF